MTSLPPNTETETESATIPVLRREDWFDADGFPINVQRRDPQEPFGIHCHDFCEIVIVTGGSGLHITGKDAWELSPGDAFVIGGSRPHDYVNMDQLRLINILFDPASIDMQLYDLPSLPGYHALFHLEPAWRQRHQFESRLRLTARDLTTTIGLVNQLEGELKRRDKAFGFTATAIFMQLTAHLSRCYGNSEGSDSISLLRLAETITYIETHYADPLQLKDLISVSRMSRRSYLRAFRTATGRTPIAYLLKIRIAKAAELLRSTQMSVTEIAFEVGFSDSNYFSRQFRGIMGKTPSQYRQTSMRINDHRS
ncbi:helix-turn-helix domain-containing protein [Planctomycetes bacterium CA13]